MRNFRFPTRTIVVVAPPAQRPDAPVEPAPVKAEAQKEKARRLKGFGYIYQRGPVWWIRYSVHGKDFRESSGSEKDTDAMRLLKSRWQEVGRGRFIGPSADRVMMDDLLDALEVNYTINGRRSLGTLKGRIWHLRAAFGNMRAMDVTEERIERYKLARLQEKTRRGKRLVKPATVNRELAALRKAFRLAVKQKRLGAAPSIELLAENNVRQGFVEAKDFETIVSKLPGHLQDPARFAYVTGWRSGEVKTLEWSDVNRDAQTILLRSENSKNGEPRMLPLIGGLSEIIERCWAKRTIQNADGSTALARFVFHQGDGQKLGDHRKAWKAACTAAEMPGLRLHDLRRSAVRNFDNNGVSQAVGMMITGHKTAAVYRRYRIVPENDIREALARTQAAITQSKKGRPARRVVAMEAKKAVR